MLNIEEGIKSALIERGSAAENWRVKITGCDRVGKNSDYVRVYVDVFKPHSRKPDVMWDLCINAVKNLVFFDRSNFFYPKNK